MLQKTSPTDFFLGTIGLIVSGGSKFLRGWLTQYFVFLARNFKLRTNQEEFLTKIGSLKISVIKVKKTGIEEQKNKESKVSEKKIVLDGNFKS